jgi:hypothetical protein
LTSYSNGAAHLFNRNARQALHNIFLHFQLTLAQAYCHYTITNAKAYVNRISLLLILIALFSFSGTYAQRATITGKITDSTGMPLVNASIHIVKSRLTTVADVNGVYTLSVPADSSFSAEFSYISFAKKTVKINALKPGEVHKINIVLGSTYTLDNVVVNGKIKYRKRLMDTVNPVEFQYNPTTTGDVSAIVKNLPGVHSSNELSTQYTVRGGNYDENLVYLNDIEIFRPVLVRSGQEEGLSIINTDMIQSLQFSAGGFEARYGDRLSSVLDIQYKEPDSFAAKFTASLMGTSGEIEGCSNNHRFTYLIGARYRDNGYLLKSLDVKGTYKPSFGDVQSYLTYYLADNLKISLLTYFGQNKYLSQPTSATVPFGTATQALQLQMTMGGQELLKYWTLLNGLTLDYDINKYNKIKLIGSVYNSDEQENYDILSTYELQALNTNAGADLGKVAYTLGDGQLLDHGRDHLNSLIYNAEIKGYHSNKGQFDLEWGLKAQHENILDYVNEYKYMDSADHSVPAHGDSFPGLYDYIYSSHNLSWNRYMAYAQNIFTIDKDYNSFLTAGLRANYWDYNQQLLISPRMQFTFEPNVPHNRKLILEGAPDSLLRNNIRLKFAAGVYDQPPFYRELRNEAGQVNPEIRAQRSIHFVVGQDLSFKFKDRPFKFTTEAYYKLLQDIIPYEFDNERIRYYGANNAHGYSTGIDFQLNGELAHGNPSWVSMSIMKTMEDLNNDSLVEISDGKRTVIHPGYLPRPTDQRVQFSMFFQDYIPNYPDYKVHLQLVYGTGLPFWPPGFTREYVNTVGTPRTPPYRRVDIGFSRMLYDQHKHRSASPILKPFRSIWLSAEIFNMLGVNNTVNYLWVKDVSGDNVAVPSYLTGRRLNIHLEVKF